MRMFGSAFATWAASNPRLWTAWFIPGLLCAPSWTLFSSRYYESFNHDPSHSRADTDVVFNMIGVDAENMNVYYFLYVYFLSPYQFAPAMVAAMDLPGQGYSDMVVQCAGYLALAAQTIYPLFMAGSFCKHGFTFLITRFGQELGGYGECLFQYYVAWWIFPKWMFEVRFAWVLFGNLICAPINFILQLLKGRNPAMPQLRRQSSSDIFFQAMRPRLY